MTKNLKPLFLWAKTKGDANIYDRILIKIIPELLKENVLLTTQIIESSESIYVSEAIYTLTVSKTEELLNAQYEEGNNV